jgi:myo-inositol-1(or 4)-monophosphatase
MTNRFEFTKDLARRAGDQTLTYWGHDIDVQTKDGDPRDYVTQADLEISSLMVNEIQEAFPGEIVYSEESPDVDVSSGSYWALDPIDGTANFSRHIPHYASVVSYVENGVPVVGAVYNPVTKELFSFEKDQGAFLNSKAIRVSNIRELKDASVFLRAGRKPELWDWGGKAYAYLLEHAGKTYNYGSSSLDVCFVAAGRTEACVYGRLTTIDIVAAFGIIAEAGGVTSDQQGNPLVISKAKTSLVAANNSDILESVRKGIF